MTDDLTDECCRKASWRDWKVAATIAAALGVAACGPSAPASQGPTADAARSPDAHDPARADAPVATKTTVAAVYRFAKISNGAYFYTGSEEEKNLILASFPDFRYEGVAYGRVLGAGQPVYRFANLLTGGYFYTANEAERDIATGLARFRFEGASFSVATTAGADTIPVYRLANLLNGAYLYTASAQERAFAVGLGHWRDEGTGFHAYAPPPDLGDQSACTMQYTLAGNDALLGTDPLLAQQWHLQATGWGLRATEAWSVTRGSGVRVAVIDDAIETLHRDLAPNVVTSASYNYRSGNRGNAYPLPCGGSETHGTAVAGIIAMRDGNAEGGAGVAPLSRLVGYNALASATDADIADALTRDLASNAVYNNSWGSPDDGGLHPAPASFAAAIENGIANGRGGLGAIYVFPAGNGRQRSDNANYDGFVNKPGVLTVCAVGPDGVQPFYGEPGANVLVCGPSAGNSAGPQSYTGVTTTALRGAYRDDFAGTSAAAPMVSGVVALMLARNPGLSWRDVRLILAGTARQNDPLDPGWTTNFGYRFNHKYGFGTVDAVAAVSAAASWNSVGGSASMKSCGPYARTPGRAVPDLTGVASPVSDTVGVAGCAISQIEFIEVRLTAPHGYAGDLRVRLTSPNALVSELATHRGCNPCGAYADWPFGSVRHLGEAVDGNWTLELTDMAPADEGRFERWSIRFWGR